MQATAELIINPLYATSLLLYSLKTSENFFFPDVSTGIELNH